MLDQNEEGRFVPFHGYARGYGDPIGFAPPVSVVIGRQTGSRGGSIASRVAETLGCPLFDQETVDWLSRDGGYPSSEPDLSPEARAFVDARLAELESEPFLQAQPELIDFARLVLELAASGSRVFLGSAAGVILPREARLRVELAAPEDDRVAWIAQLERLSPAEARRVLLERDGERSRFPVRQDGVPVAEAPVIDLMINTSTFGIEGSAGLIVAAIRERDGSAEDDEVEAEVA
jgi:hypothetical protein